MTENYISIPRKLILSLRDNPLALALYFFIARLYLVQQRPVPLSRGDIRLFDPTAKVGAVKRALDRLVDDGWLIEQPGYKYSYTPSWGTTRTGAACPWRVGEALLGCPPATWRDATRVDRGLLDTYMGRLTPQPRLAATVEGYVVTVEGQHTTLLTLQDVGTYILLAASLPTLPTAALRRWQLVRGGDEASGDDSALPLPDVDTVLALASQRACIASFQLSKQAWQKLGVFAGMQRQPEASGAPATPLLFVPSGQIGGLIPPVIGERIGQGETNKECFSAAERRKARRRFTASRTTGNQTDSNELRESPSSPPSGGGSISSGTHASTTEQPDTEAAQALKSFGVHDLASLHDLSTLTIEQVGGAIHYAQESNLGPGWVVTALRRHQVEGWAIPVPRRSQQPAPVNWSEVAQQDGDFFRRGGDVTDLPCLNLRDTNEEPADLTSAFQERLRRFLGGQHTRLIQRVSVRVCGEVTVLHCASAADRVVLTESLSLVRKHLMAMGLPALIRFDTP